MKIIESPFADQILKVVKNSLGDIFFLDDIAVVELSEGTHFDMRNSDLIINELLVYFGTSKPYGVVANRINSYSVNLIDIPHFKNQAKNLKAYGVVGHDLASKMNAEIENRFCYSGNVNYDTLSDAIKSVSKKIKNNTFSLN